MRFHRGYAVAAVAIFLVEVCIALFVKDGFIRPIFGDVLAVMMVYCGWLSIFDTRRITAAIVAFVVRVCVEVLQAVQFITLIGLEQNAVAKTVLGTTFAWTDILAYAIGVLAALGIDQALQGKAKPSQRP